MRMFRENYNALEQDLAMTNGMFNPDNFSEPNVYSRQVLPDLERTQEEDILQK